MVHHKDVWHHISYQLNGLSHKSELNFKGPQVKHDKESLMKTLLSSFHLKGHSWNVSLQSRRNFGKRVLSALRVLQQKAGTRGVNRETDRRIWRLSFYAFWIQSEMLTVCGFNILRPNFGLCL